MKQIHKRIRKENKIVGFCGKKRSGKDTAGQVLVDMGFRTIAFADPIKEVCRNVFFSDEQLSGPQKEEVDEFWEFSPRWAMQQVGNELFREGIDRDVWVKSLLKKIDESDHDKWAVTDVRQQNEIDHLQKAGGHIIYIRRPETEPDLNPIKKKIAMFAATGSSSWKMVKQIAELFTDFGPEYHASELAFENHPSIDSPDIINDADTVSQFQKTVRLYVKNVQDFQNRVQLISSSVEKHTFDDGRKVHGANLK